MKIFNQFIIATLALSILVMGEGKRQNSEYRSMTQKVTGKISVDGIADEPEWRSATRYQITYEIQPGDNVPASVKTEFSTLYDDENVYFVFYCYDPNPALIRANFSDRDHIFRDDYVGVIIDPFMDNQRVYEFLVNPLGIQGDLLRMGNNEDMSFDALWYSAGKVNNDGYVVEIALPFKSLRFPEKDIQNWGLFAGRIYPRDNSYLLSWTPNDRNNPCFMCQAGILEGLQNISQKLSYEVLPYMIGFQSGQMNDADDPSLGFTNGKLAMRVGTGFKITPSSSLVVEGVINPDFSQIESDAQQISVNNTFALFYPEKRPFFLEGVDIFRTPFQVYHSRMINNPLYAAKLTGKSDKFSYALLSALDRNTVFILPGEEGSDYEEFDLRSVSNVGRLRYDFGEETYAGAFLSNRSFKGGNNTVTGLDFNYLFFTNYTFRGQFLFTHTKEMNDPSLYSNSRKFGHTGSDAGFNGESYNGTAVQLQFKQNSKYYFWGLFYRDVSPAFQSQIGFINSSNVRNYNISGGISGYPDSSILKQYNIFSEAGMTFNHASVHKENYIYFGGNLQLKGQTYINFGMLPVNDEIYHDVQFRKVHRINTNIYSNPWSELSIGAWFEIGKFIYREDDPSLGKGHYIGCEIGLRPTDKLQYNLSFNRARLSNYQTDELFYDGYILRNTLSYQFSHEMFFRMILEYNSFDHAINLFPLFSYKMNPFTIFYIGATSDMSEYDSHKGFLQREKQYFAKIQYLFNN